MFTLTAEAHHATTLLRYAGDMCLADVPSLSRQLEEQVRAPRIRQVALDLSRVGKADRSGLGALVRASTLARGMGRRLVLLSVAPHVVTLLQQAEIEGFFPTFDTEEELLGSASGLAG